MIHHVQDNLLNFTSWNVIAHSCNTLNTFGAGLALQIKDEYPCAWEADCKAAEARENTLGGLSYAVAPDNKRILNMYTQSSIGTDKRQVDYEALYVCLEGVKMILENAHQEGRIHKLGLPKGLSSGLAGGSEKIVLAMIEHFFADSPIDVYIVEYKKK